MVLGAVQIPAIIDRNQYEDECFDSRGRKTHRFSSGVASEQELPTVFEHLILC